MRINDKKPVLKGGKFFFYNSIYRRDTIITSAKRSISLSSCLCGIKQPAKKEMVVSSGPMVLYITSQDATCGYGSGSIIVQVANGIPPYTFTLTENGFTDPPQNTGNFPVVGAGIATITVTDSTGAIATADVVIKDIFPGPVVVPTYQTQTPTNINRYGGEVTMYPTGGTPPYSYSMDLIHFQTSNVFSNLSAGIYQLYAKDANGCIGINEFFVIGGSGDGAGFIGGGYECANDGHLTIKSFGSNGPYQYSIDSVNYQSSEDFYNLGPGVLHTYIKDNKGNVQIIGFNFAQNCALNLKYIAVDAACGQNDGSMTITGANGTPPYSYTIDGINYQSSNVFNNLASGNYYVTVKDASGELSSLPATVYDKCPVVRAVSSGETCGKNDGTITAAGFKGTSPYQFSINGVNFQTNNVFNNLKTGNYVVTLKDEFGFTDTTHINVTNSCMVVTDTTINSTCGKSNGGIAVAVVNGIPPYQYSIDSIHFQTGNVINNVVAGNYLVTVKDSTGVIGTVKAVVLNTAGAKVTASVTPASCLNNDGALTATNTDGKAPFQFSMDGTTFQGSGKFGSLDSGAKLVYIKDANGCIASKSVTIPLIDNLTVDAGNDITVCEGKGKNLDGSTNGVSFSWSNSSGLSSSTILNPEASPSETTKYYLTATKGVCTRKDSVTVFVNPALVANAGGNITVCFGKTAQLNGSGGSEYQWSPDTYLNDPQIPDPVVTQPPSTVTYNLEVTDKNGCTSLQPSQVTVTVTPPAQVFAGNDTSILINQSLQLNAIDVNNIGFSTYTWSPDIGLNNPSLQNPVALITKDIIYTVVASTPEGCEGMDSIFIKAFQESNIFVPNAFTPNNDGLNDILKATPMGIKEFKYFVVYNRWGQKIFFTSDPGKGWDGTLQSQLQPSGIYVWESVGIDYSGKAIQRQGSVMLIR
ncbi:MAG TPA: gliding motility-associated C-terminal domain-containing protein [Hanamia sp.]|nr:gliding motility-associated C-terminal domain-containing protein [Hanamia sp.]